MSIAKPAGATLPARPLQPDHPSEHAHLPTAPREHADPGERTRAEEAALSGPPAYTARTGRTTGTQTQQPAPSPAGSSSETSDDSEFRQKLQTQELDGQQTVAPFLSRHIPDQYGSKKSSGSAKKYCYRHRPDIKCHRRVDEVTMQSLQDELAVLPAQDQQGISHVWSLFSAAPSKHRKLMLQGLMAQCCYPQLTMISSSVKELIKIDFISVLPTELAFKIFCYLDTLSLCRAAQVNRRWRQLADDDYVWQHMCEQHIDRKCTKCGWGLPLLEQKRLRSARRQMQIQSQRLALVPKAAKGPSQSEGGIRSLLSAYSADGRQKRILVLDDEADLKDATKRQCRLARGSSADEPDRRDLGGPAEEAPRRRPWKDVYRDRFKIGSNWKNGRYRLKSLRGHTNGILCVQVCGKVVATGSYDTTIKLWDVETGQELRTLRGHNSGVRCLQFDDSVLISGDMDGTTRVWDWRTGRSVRNLEGHTDGVIGLHFVRQYIATGSVDSTIRVWDTDEQCTFVLRGHTDWVNGVRVDACSRTLLSVSDDMTVRLWDMKRKECLKELRGHVGHIQQILPLPAEIMGDREAIAMILSSGIGPDEQEEDGLTSAAGSPVPRSPVLPSGRAAAVGTGDGWEWEEWEDRNRPAPPRYVLTASLDSTIYLWDVYKGRVVKKYFGHLEGVWGLTGDMLRMVSCSQDGSVKVWDLHSGRCQRTYSLHEGPVTSVSLSDDLIVSGGQDGVVHVMEFGYIEDE